MKQFRTILKFELKHYFKNKAFVGATVFLILLMAGVMFFPGIRSFLMPQASPGKALSQEGTSELPIMLIKTDDPAQAGMVHTYFISSFPDYDIQMTDAAVSDIRDMITAGSAECAFVVTGLSDLTYYVNNLSMYDTNMERAVDALEQIGRISIMTAGGMTSEQIEETMNFLVTRHVENLGKDQLENFLYTYIMIFALYMVILLYGQMVATNVASEKSSRAMELLITSADPASLMFGKVIASCLAGLVQILAAFGSALLFYHLNKSAWEDNEIIKSVFNIPPELLLYMLIFFILGFFIYAVMFGAVGSTVSKLEDINTAVMPVTMLFVIAFLVVIFSMTSANVDNPAMIVCSFIPFTSPMSMFTRIAMSTVPWYQIILSILILIGSAIGIGIFSAKIYRAGVLMYGTRPRIRNILRSIRKR